MLGQETKLMNFGFVSQKAKCVSEVITTPSVEQIEQTTSPDFLSINIKIKRLSLYY